MSSSIPQIRSVPESEMEGPAFKKQRLEANDDSDTRPSLETVVQIEVDEEISQLDAPVRVDSSSVGGANSISKPKKSRKKRKDPPLPEPCSAADVLYQEIRTLLGEAVVDRITEDGGAFKSPYSYGEEIVVKIEVFGSGGASLSSLKSLVLSKNLRLSGSGIAVGAEDKGPWAIVVPFALMGETVRVKIVKSDRMCSYGQLLEVLVPNTELRDDSLVQCKYFGTCGGCQYQVGSLRIPPFPYSCMVIDALWIDTTRPEKRCHRESV